MADEVDLILVSHCEARSLGRGNLKINRKIASLALAMTALFSGVVISEAEELSRARMTMGTLLRVQLRGGPEKELDRIAEEIYLEVDHWDRLLSTYKDDSDVSRINRLAPGEATVSADTVRALQAALSWAERTSGTFDPTMGPLVKAWKFNSEAPSFPSEDEIERARSLVGHSFVVVTSSPPSVQLQKAGMALDFGAIGKGWALDRALEKAVNDPAVQDVALDFGGQWLFWARVARERPAAIRHPRREGQTAADLTIRENGSLSTSAHSEKYLLAREPKKGQSGLLPRRYGHILDPRTGFPAEPCESVTVWAGNATDADALSTALFVMGPKEGPAFAEKENVAAYFLFQDPKAGLISRTSSAWMGKFGEN